MFGTRKKTDARLRNCGSLYLLSPESPGAERWITENLEESTRLGNAVAIEPRYVWPIVEALEGEGLEVRFSR